MNRFVTFCIAILFYLPGLLFSQVKNTGIPNITNFTREEYNAGRQTWGIDQDNRQLMFFANNNCLLSFDGTDWTQHELPLRVIVRAISIGPKDYVYAGGFNIFGFFKPDKNGTLRFNILSNLVPDEDKNFGEIWKIFNSGEGIYFQSFTHLFLYHDNKIEVILRNANCQFAFMVNQQVFVNDNDSGLLLLKNNVLQPIEGGEVFAQQTIWSMLPYPNHKILIATAEYGFYLYDNKKVEKWITKTDEFVIKNQIFCGTRIRNNYYAFGTIQNGLIIMDSKGNPVKHFNRSTGLQNNTILSIFTDNDYNLWLGLDNGIDYIKINSPVSHLGPVKEIGAGYAAIVHDNMIYLGTNQALFYKIMDDDENSFSRSNEFKLLENTRGQVWNLQEIDGTVICGHNKGTYEIHGTEAYKISDVQGGWTCVQLPGYPNYMIEGTYTGLVLYEKNPGQIPVWRQKTQIKGFTESCREMAVDDNGLIWMAHGYKGLFKIKLSQSLDSVVDAGYYSKNEGLPTNYEVTVTKFQNRIIFPTPQGIYYYSLQKDKLMPDYKLNEIFGLDRVDKLVENSGNEIWYIQNQKLGVLRKGFNDSYMNEIVPYAELQGNYITSFECLYPYYNGLIIGTEEGFLHFDPSFNVTIHSNPSVLIRKISSFNDSIIFNGNHLDINEKIISNRPSGQIKYIPYQQNSLTFRFSSPAYVNLSQIEFQTKLTGYEDEWSAWNKKPYKEYPGLKEGSYIFQVRSRVSSYTSNISTFEFVITPPWYRSAWAIIIYIFLAAAFVLYLVNYIKKLMESEKEKLREKQRLELKRKEDIFAKESMVAEQEIIKLKNEKLQAEIDLNRSELENKSKELATITLQITYKNEILNQIKYKLTRVTQKMLHEDSKKQVLQLIKTIEKDMVQEEDWERFQMHFDQVHEDFIKKLKHQYPELTPKDLKLCAYLRMNLSTKEIAPLLNISVRGVEISRYRLRRKLQIEHEENLTEFFLQI